MIVFVVLGGWDYEGFSEDPVGVYDSLEKAEAAVERSKADMTSRYDEHKIAEMTVE